MAGMERFTQRARRVLSLAHQEAEQSRNNNIGTEHLLLALLREEDSIPVAVLKKMGINPDEIRYEVDRNLTSSGNLLTFGEIPFTPRAKAAAMLAVARLPSVMSATTSLPVLPPTVTPSSCFRSIAGSEVRK